MTMVKQLPLGVCKGAQVEVIHYSTKHSKKNNYIVPHTKEVRVLSQKANESLAVKPTFKVQCCGETSLLKQGKRNTRQRMTLEESLQLVKPNVKPLKAQTVSKPESTRVQKAQSYTTYVFRDPKSGKVIARSKFGSLPHSYR
jgi:hypothetical protein